MHSTCVPFIIVSTVDFLQLGPSRLLEDTFIDVLALQEMRLRNDTLLLPETFWNESFEGKKFSHPSPAL